MAGARQALTLRSKGQRSSSHGYENRHVRTVAEKNHRNGINGCISSFFQLIKAGVSFYAVKVNKKPLELNARDGRPYCPQSHKYNHVVRIWEVDAVGRQKIVIPSGKVWQPSWQLDTCRDRLNCASVYTVNCELCTASAQRPVPMAGHARRPCTVVAWSTPQ